MEIKFDHAFMCSFFLILYTKNYVEGWAKLNYYNTKHQEKVKWGINPELEGD